MNLRVQHSRVQCCIKSVLYLGASCISSEGTYHYQEIVRSIWYTVTLLWRDSFVGLVTLVTWVMVDCLSSFYLESCRGNGKPMNSGVMRCCSISRLLILMIVFAKIECSGPNYLILKFRKWCIPGDTTAVLLTLFHKG